jgi:hypothetical protein
MTLTEAIATHRELYRSDLLIDRLVARQPPTSLDLNTGRLHQEPAAAIGMTVSGRLLKFVSHPEGFGADFPWSKAVAKLRWDCRRNHPYHRAGDRPYWRGSLCHQLVRFVVIQGWSVENAAKILRYDNPEPVLRAAFDFIIEQMDHARAKAEKREREIEGHGPGAVPLVRHEQRHDQPGLHQEDCPKCRKSNAA